MIQVLPEQSYRLGPLKHMLQRILHLLAFMIEEKHEKTNKENKTV
jgi:hypothetical protein